MTPVRHPSVTIKNFVNQNRSILEGVFEIKKLFSRRDNIKEKETQIGTPWGTTKDGPAKGDKNSPSHF